MTIFNKYKGGIPVFDSGIGSYGVVKAIQKVLPGYPLIYLADRASFPYGKMSLPMLQKNIQDRIHWFEKHFSPPLIVIASNTPSMTVLDTLSATIPLIGVFPPIQEAVLASQSGHIAILGTQNLVFSKNMSHHIETIKNDKHVHVIPVDASILIESMESFLFVKNQKACRDLIHVFFNDLLRHHPHVDTVTLSSTHLSFLKSLILDCFPHLICLDPTESVANEVKKNLLSLKGTLQFEPPFYGDPLLVLSTENDSLKLSVTDFQKGLYDLGCPSKVHTIQFG